MISSADDKLKEKRAEYVHWLGVMIEALNACAMLEMVINRRSSLVTDMYAPKCLFDILLNKLFVVFL